MDPFQIPEDLTALSSDDLAAAINQARAEFRELRSDLDNATDDQLARVEALATFVRDAENQVTANEAAAQERRDRIAQAADVLDPQDTEQGTEDESGEDEVADDPDETADPEEAPVEEQRQAQAPQRQAASLVRGARRPRNPQPREQARSRTRMSIVAAADAGFAAGSELSDMDQVAKAFKERSRAFPEGQPVSKGQQTRIAHRVATFNRDYDGLVQSAMGQPSDFDNDESLIREAMRETRLPGGSLVAAGGWCAPSETLYDLPGLTASRDGLIDVPEFGVRRGGVNTTLGPDFASVYTGAGFAQTEAQAIAGTTKACVDITCPSFVETRLDAVGLCVRAPILTRSAYPEVVAQWIAGTVIANDHKVSVRVINAIKTALGSLVTAFNPNAVSLGLLAALELLAEGERNRYRLADSATFEVKMPHWLKLAIRADIAARNGIGLQTVTDAVIRGEFAARNLVPQFIFGLDDARVITPACLIDLPDTAEVLIYPAGTFAKGTQDVISLDTVYDTAGLQVNMFTAAFVEDGVLVVRRGYGGCRATVPVKVTGATGPQTVALYGTTDA